MTEYFFMLNDGLWPIAFERVIAAAGWGGAMRVAVAHRRLI